MGFCGLGGVVIVLIAYIFIKRRKHRKLTLKVGELYTIIEESNLTIDRLNSKYVLQMNDLSSRMKDGRMLYDHVVNNGTTSLWKKRHYCMFNEYYERSHSKAVAGIKKGRTRAQLSPHNLFYLILLDMGKTDKDIRDIMGISPEALRTLRFRTKIR